MRSRLSLAILAALFAASPAWAAQQNISAIGAQPSTQKLREAVNAELGKVQSNTTELYGSLASQSAFTATWGWTPGGVSAWSDIQALISGSGDYIKYDGTRGTPEGATYTAGTGISIDGGVISSTIVDTFATWDKDYGDLINKPTIPDITGKEDSLGNPSTNGYVLSSTTTGVRSWVEMTGGGAGIAHATSDGKWYGSKDGGWVDLAPKFSSAVPWWIDVPTGASIPAESLAWYNGRVWVASQTHEKSSENYPQSGSSYWAVTGANMPLDTDLAAVSASDDTVPSAKAAKALFDSLPAIIWGTGLTNTDNTISVTANTYQPLDADLTTWAGITPGTGVGTFLATPTSANLAAAITNETGTGSLVFSTSPVLTTPIIADGSTLTFDESAADPNDADIQLSATDGVFKIAAINGENNEEITIDLDATANKAKFGSGSGLTMITTGAIPFTGAIRVVGKSTDYTIGTDDVDEVYGSLFINTGSSTRTFTLPGAAAGMSVCVRNGQGVAQILRLAAASGDYIVKSAGARTSAAGEYYGATADAKNQLCVVAYDATDWYVTSEVGTWTEE